MYVDAHLVFFGLVVTLIIVTVLSYTNAMRIKGAYRTVVGPSGTCFFENVKLADVLPSSSAIFGKLQYDCTVDWVAKLNLQGVFAQVFAYTIAVPNQWHYISSAIVFENKKLGKLNTVFFSKSIPAWGYEYTFLERRKARLMDIRKIEMQGFGQGFIEFVSYVASRHRGVKIDCSGDHVLILLEGGLRKNIISLNAVTELIHNYRKNVLQGH